MNDDKNIKKDVDLQNGLSGEQVRQRVSEGLENRCPEPPSKTVWEIISGNLFTYFNFIFLILAVLTIISGAYRDLTFMIVITANTLIGIFQELRSKRTLDRLKVMNAPVTSVIRDGVEMQVPSEKLVLDDVVIFRSGNQISADAVVISGTVSVNESLLTGEADEVCKTEGDSLLSGSFIVSGECRARLEKVGSDSYISQLTIQAKKSRRGEQSEMIKALDKIVKIAGIIIIPIGLTLFFQQYIFSDSSVKTSIQSMTGAVIGMIPEGLFLLASTALAVSAVNLARDKVLVHDMKCIETLARADVLCVDKTGTITEPHMSVSEIVPSGRIDLEELELLLGDFVSAQVADNVTMETLKAHFTKNSGRVPINRTGFSSEYKYSSVTFEDISVILGAPDFILSESDMEFYGEISEKNRTSRILALCSYGENPDGRSLDREKTALLGFVLLSNPVRKNAPEIFRFFDSQGVDIKVISGDNPVTVSETAKLSGINGAEKYVDASELKTDEDIKKAVLEYTVFGRVTPEQKKKFVEALKSAGKTVAMTGDGVNDVLALKSADCSVAMASGSDVAVQVSQLVLLESDFSKMPKIVLEGRKIVNNIERSGSLFLVKNIFSLIISIISIISGVAYPLMPAQISLISMFTIGIPGFFLSQVPDSRLIKGKFISNILLKAIPAGLTDVLIVVCAMFFGKIFGFDHNITATACTILMGVVGLIMVYKISKPMTKYKFAICLACTFGLIFSLIFVREFFAIYTLSLKSLLLCAVLALISVPVFRIFTDITHTVRKKYCP